MISYTKLEITVAKYKHYTLYVVRRLSTVKMHTHNEIVNT